MVTDAILGFPRSGLLDADQLWLALDHFFGLDARERPAHRVLGGRIGDQDDRDWPRGALGIVATIGPWSRVALHDRFQRDHLVREMRRDAGGGAGPVDGEHTNIIAALVPLHRGLLAARERRARLAERRSADASCNVG